MTNTMLRQTLTVPAITSLDDDWTEKTVVTPDRRRVLRAMRSREAALKLSLRIQSVIGDMLACDIYGETEAVLAAVAEEVAA